MKFAPIRRDFRHGNLLRIEWRHHGIYSKFPVTIQENVFHAYIEKWEEPLLTISEATDSTARFRLATKYMGVVVCDKRLNEWRVVVDDADDSEEIREPFIINAATFVDIIAAASAQTRPMIMKTAAVESSGEE